LAILSVVQVGEVCASALIVGDSICVTQRCFSEAKHGRVPTERLRDECLFGISVAYHLPTESLSKVTEASWADPVSLI